MSNSLIFAFAIFGITPVQLLIGIIVILTIIIAWMIESFKKDNRKVDLYQSAFEFLTVVGTSPKFAEKYEIKISPYREIGGEFILHTKKGKINISINDIEKITNSNKEELIFVTSMGEEYILETKYSKVENQELDRVLRKLKSANKEFYRRISFLVGNIVLSVER